jgi:hypothetical protein
MRLLHLLPLLASLLAPAAMAERLYQVELILFRQSADALLASQAPAEDWASGAPRLDAASLRSPALQDAAAKLSPAQGYQVLLHQAWQQPLQAQMNRVSLVAGEGHFDQFPAQGVIGLSLGETLQLEADLWANQFDDSGLLLASERLRQSRLLKAGELTYLDHGSLGALIRVSPL